MSPFAPPHSHTRAPSHPQTIAEVTAELEERRGEAGDSAKYELLFRRDQEMTEYIDRYPELKEREVGRGEGPVRCFIPRAHGAARACPP